MFPGTHILSFIFNRKLTSFTSHPHSVDALAALTSDVIVTGSSDGLVRVVQLLPHKLLGVIAGPPCFFSLLFASSLTHTLILLVDHGTFPIERLRTDRNGAWLGSASHDDVLKLTDIRDALVDSDEDSDGGSDSGDNATSSQDRNPRRNSDDEVTRSVDQDSSSDEGSDEEKEGGDLNEDGVSSGSGHATKSGSEAAPKQDPNPEHDSDQDSQLEPEPEQPSKQSRKRKKKEEIGIESQSSNKKGKVDDGFFSGL